MLRSRGGRWRRSTYGGRRSVSTAPQMRAASSGASVATGFGMVLAASAACSVKSRWCSEDAAVSPVVALPFSRPAVCEAATAQTPRPRSPAAGGSRAISRSKYEDQTTVVANTPTFLSRATANIVDYMSTYSVAAIYTLIGNFMFSKDSVYLRAWNIFGFFLGSALEPICLYVNNGVTLGRSLMGYRVRSKDGKPLSLIRSFARFYLKSIFLVIEPPVLLVRGETVSEYLSGTQSVVVD